MLLDEIIVNCSYGVGSGFISMTIPYNMDFAHWFGVTWSIVPYASIGFFIFAWLATRRVSFLIIVWLAGTASLLNEVAIGKILQQGRPPHSCLTSQAFPSGHAFNSIAVFVFVVLEACFRPYWSIPRKLFIVLTVLVVFFPVPFARLLVGDHTWFQVGIGMACGLIWSILNFLFFRFVFARFINEKFQVRKLLRILCRNDYDPEYKYVKLNGKEFKEKTTENKTIRERKVKSWNKRGVLILHVVFVVMYILLGILGIVIYSIKLNWDPQCYRAAPAVLLTTGCMTIFKGLIMILITILIWLKVTGKWWFPTVLHYSLYAWGYLYLETSFWNYCGIPASSEPCASSQFNISLFYSAFWFGLEALLVLVHIIFYFLWNLKALYSTKTEQQQTEK